MSACGGSKMASRPLFVYFNIIHSIDSGRCVAYTLCKACIIDVWVVLRLQPGVTRYEGQGVEPDITFSSQALIWPPSEA